MRKAILFLLFTCALSVACTCGKPKEENTSVSLRGSSMFHQDSLEYYRHRAYRLEEPEALYITAAAAYLKSQGDPNMDTLETVSIEVADSMLMDAAAQNYKPAIDAIHCLHENGCWHHEY